MDESSSWHKPALFAWFALLSELLRVMLSDCWYLLLWLFMYWFDALLLLRCS